eukprot:481597_1
MLIRRLTMPTYRRGVLCAILPHHSINISRQYFGNTSKKKPSDSKPTRQKRQSQRIQEDAADYGAGGPITRSSKPPSETDEIRFRITKCNEIDQIMNIIKKNIFDDPTVYGKAMEQIVQICKDHPENYTEAKSKVFEIWELMKKFSYTDAIGWHILLKSCNIFGYDHLCHDLFFEMLKEEIQPTAPILTTMLNACRPKGKVEKAHKYWDIITNKYKLEPNELNYQALFTVYAKAKICDHVLLQDTLHQMKEKHKVNHAVCWRLMSVYANIPVIEGVESIRDHMQKHKVKFDANIYNTMALAYILAKDYEKAISIIDEAIECQEWDSITIIHQVEAYICKIKNTNDQNVRKSLLKFVEIESNNYLKQCKNGMKTYNSHKWKCMMFSAIFNTYDGFGPQLFKEFMVKYQLEYWDRSGNYNVPTIDLWSFDMEEAKWFLTHIFNEELNVFDKFGLNILTAYKTDFRFQEPATSDGLMSFLAEWNPPITVVKEKRLLHIPKDQTANFHAEEPLFG